MNSKDVLVPNLTEFSAEKQRQYDLLTTPRERKERGHFGTPAAIAEYMSGMFSFVSKDEVRILDPGAGVGILSAALSEKFLEHGTSTRLCFELWENDTRLIPLLEETMARCRDVLNDAGIEAKYTIHVDDFILANGERNLFGEKSESQFDLAILNPPYFKLRKDSPHARAMPHVVHGQPNIYALFLAMTAGLLGREGEMVAITPRSYFNGPYFKRFRRWFLDRMTIRQIHVFESRSKAFQRDGVLQENVIVSAVRDGRAREVVVTTDEHGNGRLTDTSSFPYDDVVFRENGDRIIRIATNRIDRKIVEAMDRLPGRFRESGYEISTGPVVSFRSTKHLRKERSRDTAPLLWMHNVRPFITQFPPANGKPPHIEISDSSKKLLVPSKTYILLKRFTAKEEKRRLVAGIMKAKDSYSEWVGIENHLNYVYRKRSDLTLSEAYGLAAYFNSAFVDRYFRVLSGNTQVNAAEIRNMPVPDKSVFDDIGQQVQQLGVQNLAEIERVVGDALNLPEEVVGALIEESA